MFLGENDIENFKQYLMEKDKSKATVEKYLRDVGSFVKNVSMVNVESVREYRKNLCEKYAVRSVNSIVVSINCFLEFLGLYELKMKTVKMQKMIFRSEEKELTRSEYERLCKQAKSNKNERLNLIMQTICATGIRVSELPFVTVKAVKCGEATVKLKGKVRVIFFTEKLRKKLLFYAEKMGITDGMIFITRNGKAISRTNIWREMKKLCVQANINPQKVFPHNLRHLFARVFYGIEKDIVKLADILGHSSIETTRIYIISTGAEHRRKMENMRLII